MASDDRDTRPPFDPGRRWRLHPRVALRPEPFGALAYHYDNRRLNFLRSPDLVRLVESLADHPDPRQAFDAQGLDDRRWPSFERALLALARSEFIEPVPEKPAGPPVDTRSPRGGSETDERPDR
jgi:putative mycofactocin binding protein MftB